jgi:hypothetical protein
MDAEKESSVNTRVTSDHGDQGIWQGTLHGGIGLQLFKFHQWLTLRYDLRRDIAKF